MQDVYWRSTFPQAYQKVRQIPLARNLPPAQWMFLSLESGFLKSEDYLAWARPFYGLATLENSFFKEQFTPSTYEKYKDLFNWGPQALPIFEWDGVLFVACVDPHSVPSHLEMVCRPLLASYESLDQGWKTVTANEAEIAIPKNMPPETFPESNVLMEEARIEANEPPEMMEEFPLNLSDPPSPENDIDFSFPTDLPSMPSEPKCENLFELEDSPPPLSGEGDDLVSDKSQNSVSAFEMPEGLNFSQMPSEKPTLPTVLPMPTPVSKVVPTVPPMPTPISKVMPSEPPIPTTTAPLTPPPKPSVKTAPPTPPSKVSRPPHPMELEEELKLSFAKAYQSYRNLMILKLNEDVLLPFRWDPSYKKPKALEAIELTQPSVFRIAAKTQKPFHGPVSPNEVNKSFFDNWFGGHLPTYLTIIPLFFERECVGLLLGAADEELDRKDSLQLMESTAQKVEANFGARLAS